MNVILIDDEHLALSYLEKKLQAIESVQVLATFTRVTEAFLHIERLKPDVVFLDINMQEMNGLIVAEKLIEHMPQLNIVFVTAYDQYAVQAFELNAIDYLLKPVTLERLTRTIERIEHEEQPETEEPLNEFTKIQCFRRLNVTLPDGHTVRWRTKKAKELFAFLLHHRDHAIHKDVIIDELWQDVDLQKANNLLYTTVYQIRKTLKNANGTIHLTSKNSSYQLKLPQVKLDVDHWISRIKLTSLNENFQLSEHAVLFHEYTGDYFEEEGYLWAKAMNERLRRVWYHYGLDLGKKLLSLDERDAATSVYLKLQESFPDSEPVAFELMQLCAQIRDHTAVHRYYNQLCEVLQHEFGISPQPEIQSWYAEFMKQIERNE